MWSAGLRGGRWISTLLGMGSPQPRQMLDTDSPFTRADARAAGITEKGLLSGRYQKVHYDTYVSAHVLVTPQVRARAALHVAPRGAYVSHLSAAELLGTAGTGRRAHPPHRRGAIRAAPPPGHQVTSRPARRGAYPAEGHPAVDSGADLRSTSRRTDSR